MIHGSHGNGRTCPDCNETVANVQGIDACPRCRWNDRYVCAENGL